MAAPKKKKSTVNEAGNYTKPTMRKRLFKQDYSGELRAAKQDSGAHERLRCLPSNTKKQEEVTNERR